MSRKVLLANGADIDAQDSTGRTALAWATISDQNDVLQALIDRGTSNGIISRHQFLTLTRVNSWELSCFLSMVPFQLLDRALGRDVWLTQCTRAQEQG